MCIFKEKHLVVSFGKEANIVSRLFYKQIDKTGEKLLYVFGEDMGTKRRF